jgi:hypothetical protein
MASYKRDTESDTFSAQDEIDLLFSEANPNPERIGCPSDDVLTALARRERPMSDPGYEHLARCSNCYRAMRARQQATTAMTAAHRRRVFRWLGAVATLVIVCVATWLFVQRGGERRRPSDLELQARLDLRGYGVVRSTPDQPEQQPLRLRRGRLRLTLLLPVGFESGEYDLQLLDSDMQSRVSATGKADIRSYVTTLETNLDLRALSAGSYRLALRRRGENWRFVSAQVE